MFAVKDKRSGKFLRNFSGSFNSFESNGKSLTHKGSKTHDEMWCLDSPAGAKLYNTKGGIKHSIGYKEWIEIVDVNVTAS